jgi:isoleucyl-tRNA synthetase
VLAMYEMYADDTKADANSNNVLDHWMVTRLNQVIGEVTDGYTKYELDKATRPLADLIDDLSVWYLRRSRERLKSDDAADKALALGTLRYVLRELAKVMAPAMPFYAEYLYRAVRDESEAESVHLARWPESIPITEDIITAMAQVREIVTGALEARTKSGIKVRQPIASVTGPELSPEYQSIVLDELNAKEYKVGDTIVIDTILTPALIAEGAVREVMRAVQDMRKQADLTPSDIISLVIGTDEAGQTALETPEQKALLTKTVNARSISYADTVGQEVVAGEYRFVINLVQE